MGKPVYKCPHCKKEIEIELTKQGQLLLNGSTVKEQQE